MVRLFRHIMLVLAAFALVVGSTAEVVRAAPLAPMAGEPCDMAMPDQASGGDATPMPCKGLTPDCIKQMGCVAVIGLPANSYAHETIVQYGTVDFWASLSKLESLDPEPEPLPPRTA